MTLVFEKGDLFSQPAEALVNTVNCVGVMGKGVALEFKKRWPDNYKAYKRVCDAQELAPGRMFVFDRGQLFHEDGPRYIINFPTKDHWRAKSKIEYVSDGLDALVDEIKKRNISSIAMPPLGCGNGGLDWKDVRPLIETRLSALPDVHVIVLAPRDAEDEPEHSLGKFTMNYERAVLLKSMGDLEGYFDGNFDRISLQKIVYFLQALGIPFNLQFSRNLHGPYSESLRKALIAFEKLGVIKGFVSGDRQSHVTPGAYAAADEYLKESENSGADVIERLGKLIQGYESPYGLELLSSVHWLAVKEKHYPVEKIIEAMQDWNENKRNTFGENVIRLAYERLKDDALVA
ncbi:Appr-1-p processing protein [Agrobacterium vitis]|uniref:type II toxin-antitoxin system antitoxin DNA ADP-ribosyl glycohydrolase DarG n=1 Tax=Agrobacterium vitis TaxID=373 RepID=UPI0012E78A0F|nr:macro domain-containing protein [Agrobacterium vitis]MVA72232.1 Appr-1-p processing protein [Agrobacterium vitis]